MVTEGTAQIRPFLIADAAGDRLRNGRATYGTMPATGFAMAKGRSFSKTGEEIEALGKERPLRACECVVLRSAGGYFTFLMNRITTAPIVTAAMAIGNTKK